MATSFNVHSINPKRWHPFPRTSFKVGTFVVLWIVTAILILFTLLSLGVNPTLVISVISAPFWVLVILACAKLTKMLMKE